MSPLDKKKSKLLIISDTPMWRSGRIVSVFEATLREVEFFSHLFNEITWIGFEHAGSAPMNSREDRTGKIRFVLLPRASGGTKFIEKFRIVPFIPIVVKSVIQHSRCADIIHTRGPSLPALISILSSFCFNEKRFWHKFAGNWGQVQPPTSYRIQRALLKKMKNHVVTINGIWPDTPSHIRVFENPCFTAEELDHARESASHKRYDGKLTLLFVGRMEYEKGAMRIIEALLQIQNLECINELIFVGHGKDFDAIMTRAKNVKLNVRLVGLANRKILNEIYAKSHIFLLPSTASEGFPKVIAEAAAFGCVPIVSTVSSITNYVHDKDNGFLLWQNTPQELSEVLLHCIENRSLLTQTAKNALLIPEKFTYERYNYRLQHEILL